jgi:hypothetical protein
MRKLLPLFTGLFTALLLAGCALWSDPKPKTLPPLPEPATTTGLTGAEKDLDKATAERLSKVSASVGMSYVLAQKNPQSLSNDVLLSELKLAKTLTGKAEEQDWVTVKKRVESALGGGDLSKLYEKEQAEASALRSKLKEADAKYEAEKAKKQAEFDAKLLEREQEIKREQEMRRVEALETRKDKFMWLGGLICLAGAVMFVFASKQDGIEAFVAGVAIASIGQIWDSPYFPYAIGGMLLLALVKVALLIFKKKSEVKVVEPKVDKESEG